MAKEKYILTFILCLCLTLIILPTEQVYAQENIDIKEDLRIPDSTKIQILTTQDGSTLIGRIVEIGESEIQFETDLGKMTIPILKIQKIKEVPTSSIKKGKYWFQNPNATRLFFAPTGRSLKKGDGYFADYYIFFPMFGFGVTNNITLAGGISLFPGAGLNQLFYFAPKLGLISIKNLDLSVGAMVVKLPSFGNEDVPTVGILYSVGTFGGSNASLTAGFGYGFVDTDFADKPMVMLGGEVRASRNIAFVTENWIFPGLDTPILSLGMRFFGEKLSVDLALATWITDGEIFLPGIPYVDFVYHF